MEDMEGGDPHLEVMAAPRFNEDRPSASSGGWSFIGGNIKGDSGRSGRKLANDAINAHVVRRLNQPGEQTDGHEKSKRKVMVSCTTVKCLYSLMVNKAVALASC